MPIGKRLAQRTVGLHQAIIHLFGEPILELIQQRLALRLVVSQPRWRAHLLVTGLFIMVENRLEGIKHHLACAWKELCDVAALTTSMRQAVATNNPFFIPCMPR